MCAGCWKEYGSPRVVTDKTRLAASLIEAVYDHDCSGGNLHAQIDDWNLDDDLFEEKILVPLNPDASKDRIYAEARCYEFMKGLTVEERASALAIVDGLVVDGKVVDLP